MLFRSALIVCLGLVAAGLYGSAAEEKESAPAKERARLENAKARGEAAKKAYVAALERHAHQPEIVGSDVPYLWSVRWFQAERDFSKSKADRMAASERHLKRMQGWRERTLGAAKAGGIGPDEVSGAEFYVLEAEDWLMAAQGETK